MEQEREVFERLAKSLRAALPALALGVSEAVGRDVAEYARPLEGRFGRNLTLGVERALAAFVDLLEDPARPTLPRSIYVELGRGELREGRGLDALLSAYRVGARVAWRTVGDHAVAAGASASTLVELADMLFSYIDGMSALSARGYAEEQAARAGERDRRRAELARLLVTGVDEDSLRELAPPARWPPPDKALAVLFPPEAKLDRLPPESLVWPREDDVVAVVASTSAMTVDQLRRRLEGTAAVIGLVVPTLELPHSLAAAEALRAIAGAARPQDLNAVRPSKAAIVVDDHLLDLVLRADSALLSRLTDRVLAPLQSLPESARERLAMTLLAWLAHAGARGDVAAALHVHPQTVRYRMSQLRDVFGDVLEDPEQRTALTLVLRAALGPVPRAEPEKEEALDGR